MASAIKALNPVAEIVYAEYGNVPLKRILGTGRFDLDRASRMAGWFKELAGEHIPETEAFGISSFVVRIREPLHPQRFAAFIELPLPGILRAKGYVWLASRPEWAISYSRSGNTAAVEPVGRWWAAVSKEGWPAKGSEERALIGQNWQPPYGDRINEVVFIGRHREWDRALIETAFAACTLTSTELRKGIAHWRKLPDSFPEWTAMEVKTDVAAEEEAEHMVDS